MSTVMRGVIPVAPTVFTEDETIDWEGQRRVIRFLADAGSDAICILANYSEQFSLTDEERSELVRVCLEEAADRVPIVVTASHYSARIAASRCREAESRGAAMVMLMPPFFGATMSVAPAGVVEWMERVTDGLALDVMIQDAPLSTTPLSVETLTRLSRDIPTVRYAKVEVARTADKITALVASAGEDLPGIFDGEEGVTLIPDLDAGAVGSMGSALLPEILGDVVRLHLGGDRPAAQERWEGALPLIQFENRQCGLAAAKIVLAAGGVIRSAATRAPYALPSAAAQDRLLELARRRDLLALRWA